MQQRWNRRYTPLVVLGMVLALSGGAAALPFSFPTLQDYNFFSESIELFQATFEGFNKTGFSIKSFDGSSLSLSGTSKFEPEAGLESGQRVQEGFVLLDGTLSLSLTAATKGDGTRARTRTTYRMDVRRTDLRRDSIARALVRQGVVRDGDIRRARTRARAMDIRDARVMRLVEGRDGSARWIRAVRAIRTPERIRFRARQAPTRTLGNFGFDREEGQAPYVWAVMDRNSRYAVGLTVDRDNDGVPNASDNCIGTANSNQTNSDSDSSGDACDFDDDNDKVFDDSDNCPLSANADQADFDADGTGNACDFDDDNDRVSDGADRCQATAFGSVVDATGCSVVDLCPCGGTWRNHGAYTKCVAQASGAFVSAGLLTEAQKDAIVSAAAQSSCGQ